MIRSQAIQFKDFSSRWYLKWSLLLKQEERLYGRLIHNKAWQNAIILQALYERGYLKEGMRALGFGVGTERIPSALAALGLKVTATDQDIKSGQRRGWDNIGQLTHTRNDLNQYGIVNKKLFDKNVTFKNCDMNNIGNAFNDQYDIIWSNCALGHLGSIDLSLKFIEKSLDTLKPGGIAVHTTEVNVVSNTETLDTGGTVIFRRGDFINLFYKLRSQGYKCAPLSLNFGSLPEDQRFSAMPYEDDPLLKLNVAGHLISQVVLIIIKPPKLHKNSLAAVRKNFEEKLNNYQMQTYLNHNKVLQNYLTHQKPQATNKIKPEKVMTKITLKPKQVGSVHIQFKNVSNNYYYDMCQIAHNGSPLVIATSNPINRLSKISTATWPSKSRPILRFSQLEHSSSIEGIAPGSIFWADISVKAPAKSGKYIEDFCAVVESLGIIPNSEFSVELTVSI